MVVPRRVVPTDSTACREPSGNNEPAVVTLAGTADLLSAPFGHRIRLAWPLPRSSSIVAYWLDEGLAPGASVGLEQRYLTAGGAGTREG